MYIENHLVIPLISNTLDKTNASLPTTTTAKSTTTTSKPNVDNTTDCNCDSCELPILDDCNSYILCIDRKAITISCGSGLNFNVMTGTCDLEDNVQCETNIQCPEPNGRFPYPHSCAHFMDCDNNVITVRKCPEEMVFDKDSETCTWDGTCEYTTTTKNEETTTPNEETTTPNEETTTSNDNKLSTESSPSDKPTTKETTMTSFVSTDKLISTKITDIPQTPSSTSTPEVTTVVDEDKTTISPTTNKEITITNDFSTINSTIPADKDTTISIATRTSQEDITTSSTITEVTSEASQPTTRSTQPEDLSSSSAHDLSTAAQDFTSTTNKSDLPISSSAATESTEIHPSPSIKDNTETTSAEDQTTTRIPSTTNITTEKIVTANLTTTVSSSSTSRETTISISPESSTQTPTEITKSSSTTISFNASTSTICDWPGRAGCGSLVLPTTDTTQNDEDTTSDEDDTCDCECCFYPDTTDCSRYTLCLDGVLHRGQCAEGLLFDAANHNCDLAERVNCTQSSLCSTQDGIYSNPNDCSTYYKCTNGQPSLESCPVDKHFNAADKKCVEPCEAQCDKTIDCGKENPSSDNRESIICGEDDGFYPVRDDCSAFYQCADGHAYLVRCPDGLHFNEEFGVCEPPCDARCDPKIDCPSSPQHSNSKAFEIDNLHCPGPDGLFPALESCDEYYLCYKGKEYLLRCPPGLHFSISDGSCSIPCDAQCDTSLDCPEPNVATAKETNMKLSSNLPPWLRCKNTNGTIPNPKDCSTFYDCSNGQLQLVQCPDGLHFDSEDKVCKSPCLAGCDLNLKCPMEIPLPKENCSCEDCFLPDPTDCSAYYFCHQSRSTKGYCPYGMLFDRKSRKCTNETSVDCEKIGDPVMCREPYGMFPYPGNCKKFIHCVDSVAHIMDCEDGLEFDPEIQTCANPKGYCDIISDDSHCEHTTGLFPHQNNCSLFYQCENGIAYLKSCFAPLVFNPINKVCDWPHNVQCVKGKSRQESANLEQAHEFKNIINDSSLQWRSNTNSEECEEIPGVTCPCACRVTTYDDCISFYQCQNDGTGCKKFCPDGLYFNRKTMVCDLPQNVECRDFFFTTLKRMKTWYLMS
ncbi:chondroitin proteoglycan 2 [Caerostris extrusa]|uniref:Chondroitin proteoglycan 2 n=1 Tax=Caerostris extrusa TaxID=172846 RepID=A0AAV4MG80_CAEEX|nr:chondroitin proteoglycan 2 [Caerostris extrusa]